MKKKYNLEEQIDEFLAVLGSYAFQELKRIYLEIFILLLAISFSVYFEWTHAHISIIISSWAITLFVFYWVLAEFIHNILIKKLWDELNNNSLRYDLENIKFCKKLLSKLRWFSLPYFFLNDLRLRRWLKRIIKNLEKNKDNK